MNTMDYQDKINLCEKLGAKKFRKLVLAVEDLKFKTIKKFCPRYIEIYDNFCDKKRDKQIRNCKTEEERKKIVEYYRRQKLLIRKEFYRGKNRNYHVDKNKPTELISYLEWNKQIHKNGMVKNAIAIAVLTLITSVGLTPAVTVPLLVAELGSLFINFQCVNLQNYNIYRYKEREEETKKKEEIRSKENIERYSKAGEVVSRSMEKTEDIPSLSQIIESVKTKEELEQLKLLVRETMKSNQEQSGKTKCNTKEGEKK